MTLVQSCTMVLSEAYLKSLRGEQPKMPKASTCRRCGYSLQGLKPGGVCPECGTPFSGMRVSGRFHDSLMDAPLEYIRTLRTGVGLLAVSALVLIAGVVATLIFGGVAMSGSALVLGVLWGIGVWLTTNPRPVDDSIAPDAVLDSVLLRQVCRGSQMAMPVGGLLMVSLWWLVTYSKPPSGVVAAGSIGIGLVYLISIVSLVPFSVYLSALSDWAGHDSLGRQFRVVITVISGGATLAVVFTIAAAASVNIRGLSALVVSWMGVLIVLASMYFLVLVIRLANATMWAIKNALFAFESQARLAERRNRDADRVADRQRNAVGSKEGHGGSWEDSGFIPLSEPDEPTLPRS